MRRLRLRQAIPRGLATGGAREHEARETWGKMIGEFVLNWTPENEDHMMSLSQSRPMNMSGVFLNFTQHHLRASRLVFEGAAPFREPLEAPRCPNQLVGP